ncbi:MAG: ribosome biogenesis GTPase Der [Planctomycetes bacterium]|nr:ribosome biogenesis GTPase Der [Planctomycetota bacterium]
MGKSSLFNVLVGRRLSIVHDIAGVTRDRVNGSARWSEGTFELIDTGGLDDAVQGEFSGGVNAQVEAAVGESDVVCLVVDAREGRMPDDERIARDLRKTGKPVVVAVNKADGPEWDGDATPFTALGWDETIPVSATTGRNLARLRAAWRSLAKGASDAPAPRTKERAIRLAVVGKRNAGKSTWVNALLGRERMIVSAIPGTTRDAVECPLPVVAGKEGEAGVLLVDTPGLRRRSSASKGLDFFSQRRGERAIEDADVVLLLLDGMTEISQVDKAIEQEVLRSWKPVIVGVNKWDLVRKQVSRRRLAQTVQEFQGYVQAKLPGLARAPVLFTAGLTAYQVNEAIALARTLLEQSRQRVPTSLLNRWVGEFWTRGKPSTKGAKRPNLYFAAQTSVTPPTIRVSVNDPARFGPSYERRLIHYLADAGPWKQVPIKIVWVRKNEPKKRR